MQEPLRSPGLYMPELPIDLSGNRNLGLLSNVVAALRNASKDHPFLLVGAQARDVLLWHRFGIETGRATLDLDFAIAVRDWSQFQRIRSAALDGGDFKPTEGKIYRLVFGRSIKVDLLPFDGVERADGSISWPPDHDFVMSTVGFHQAAESSIEVLLPNQQSVNVVSLPALAILKLVAWSDRNPERGNKDASDLHLLLTKYAEAGNLDRLYACTGIFERSDFDYEAASAWLLGRDMATIFADSSVNAASEDSRETGKARAAEKRIRAILNEEVASESGSLAAAMGARQLEDGQRLIGWLRDGYLSVEMRLP